MSSDERLAILQMVESKQISAEQALELLDALEPAEDELPEETVEEDAWMLTALLQVTEAISSPASIQDSLDDMLERVVRIVPLLAGVDRCAVFLWDQQAHAYRQGARYPVDAPPSVIASDLGAAFVGSEPVVEQNGSSRALLPMSTQGKSLGVMQVEYAQADHWFTDKELAILTNIASQAAVGVENMRLRQEAVERARLERELQLAHDVQTSLLPSSSPDVPGWQIASYWQAAHTVGGDFYDFVPVGRDQLGVVIADVSDKGMSAALFMALARSILRASITRGGSAARTLERANKLICADAHDGMFVTLFYAIIGATAGVVYANAGHTPPLLVNEHGAAVLEEGHGIALGVVSSASLAEKRLMVGVDDVLVFYTDGLTEAIDDRQEQFGLERLIQVVQNNRQRTAAGIIDEIVRALGFFAGSQPPFDDLTIIVAKRV